MDPRKPADGQFQSDHAPVLAGAADFPLDLLDQGTGDGQFVHEIGSGFGVQEPRVPSDKSDRSDASEQPGPCILNPGPSHLNTSA